MNLMEFVGQTKLVEELLAVISNRGRWNIILRGHYGFGKTTLALLIAGMFGFFSYQVPDNGTVAMAREASIQVVDEAHLVNKFEALYKSMDKKNFIFCTNMGSRLPEPFMSRCFVYRLSPYTTRELAEVVSVHARLEGTPLDGTVCKFIGDRAKGVPRNAVKLMERYVALCKARGHQYTHETVAKVFDGFGIDEMGLNEIDRSYLTAVSTHPKSQKTLMAVLDLDQLEMERVEHHLIQQGLIHITSRGRLAI